jgi:hypothetical protein
MTLAGHFAHSAHSPYSLALTPRGMSLTGIDGLILVESASKMTTLSMRREKIFSAADCGSAT